MDAESPDAAETAEDEPDLSTDTWPDCLFDGPPPDVVAPDTVYDFTYDAELDWPSSDGGHDELPPLPSASQCGDGIVDEGEECDDRNRLNGDGCDWLCRIGDGDPPPDPDPDAAPYVPDGDLIYLPDTSLWERFPFRLPLQWTGSEFATAFLSLQEDDSVSIRFRRFDEQGEPLDADWVYSPGPVIDAADLVWTGSGFGLFFTDMTYGIYYMRLSPEGKPVSDPVIVEADPTARAPAADLTGSGFVLAWITEGSLDTNVSWCGDWGAPNDTIRLRLVDFDGTTYGPPVMVEDMAGGSPDIAAGDGGFGLAVRVNSSPEMPSCSLRFVQVDELLTNMVYSGILADGASGDLAWIDGHYKVGWPHYDTALGGNTEICVASFSSAGNLEQPPACNDVSSVVSQGPLALRMAAGDRGLALVFDSDSFQRLSYLRTGLNGRAVMPPVSVVGSMCIPEEAPCFIFPYGTTWADQGFAVLFMGDMGRFRGMFLRHFIPAY